MESPDHKTNNPIPLRELVAQATPGPWHTDRNFIFPSANNSSLAHCSKYSDAQLIARLSPDVALAVYELAEYIRRIVKTDQLCSEGNESIWLDADQIIKLLDGTEDAK